MNLRAEPDRAPWWRVVSNSGKPICGGLTHDQARMFAASPDLLEMCQTVFELLESHYLDPRSGNHDREVALQDLAEVIEKATGRGVVVTFEWHEPWDVCLDEVHGEPGDRIEIHDSAGGIPAIVNFLYGKDEEERARLGELARRMAQLPAMWNAEFDQLVEQLQLTQADLAHSRMQSRTLARALCCQKSDQFIRLAKNVGMRVLEGGGDDLIGGGP